MEILSFEEAHLAGAQAVLREAFYRPDSHPLYNEWEFARRLLADPGYCPALCLVAVEGGTVVGYNALTPAWAPCEQGRAEGLAQDWTEGLAQGRAEGLAQGWTEGLALGPLAVAEARRGRGIGTTLVEEGLRRARQGASPWVAVLGGEYYRRFGFEPAAPYGLTVSEDAFENQHLQLLFLRQRRGVPSGRLRYCGVFYDANGTLL